MKLVTYETLDGKRYEFTVHEDERLDKLFRRMRKRADKSKRGLATCAGGVILLRRVNA